MSDRIVGLTHASFLAVIGPTSSGADQRTDPPLGTSDPLTEYISLAIEERPKSARQGVPWELMMILYYKNKSRASAAPERS